MRDLTVINTGNLDIDESPVLGIGHYVVRSTHKALLRFYAVTIDGETGEITDNDGPVVSHVVPEDIPVIRFFLDVPSRCSVKTSAECDWHFLLVRAESDLDTTPVEIPLGLDKPLTLAQEMQRFIRGQLSSLANQSGLESFDDANDFDDDLDEVDDWSDSQTVYQMAADVYDQSVSGVDISKDPDNIDPGDSPQPNGDQNNGKPDTENSTREETGGSDPEQ